MIDNTLYISRIGCFNQKNMNKSPLTKTMKSVSKPLFLPRSMCRSLVLLIAVTITCKHGEPNTSSHMDGCTYKNKKMCQSPIDSREDLIQTSPAVYNRGLTRPKQKKKKYKIQITKIASWKISPTWMVIQRCTSPRWKVVQTKKSKCVSPL